MLRTPMNIYPEKGEPYLPLENPVTSDWDRHKELVMSELSRAHEERKALQTKLDQMALTLSKTDEEYRRELEKTFFGHLDTLRKDLLEVNRQDIKDQGEITKDLRKEIAENTKFRERSKAIYGVLAFIAGLMGSLLVSLIINAIG